MKTANIGGKPVQLGDAEAIIWQGRPVQGLMRNPMHIARGLTLLAVEGWLLIGGNGTTTNSAFGLLIIFLGGFLAHFNAIVEKNRRASTYYVLTNQRAIVAYSLRILAYLILRDSKFTLKKGRFDTVLFDTRHPITGPRSMGFGHLENGDDVYSLLLNLKTDRATAST